MAHKVEPIRDRAVSIPKIPLNINVIHVAFVEEGGSMRRVASYICRKLTLLKAYYLNIYVVVCGAFITVLIILISHFKTSIKFLAYGHRVRCIVARHECGEPIELAQL